MSLRSRWTRTKTILGKSWYPIPGRLEVLVARAFLWWIAGTTFHFIIAGENPAEPETTTMLVGAFYGALGAFLYSATAKYRVRHGLTWAQVVARIILVLFVWGAFSVLVNNWKTLKAFFPIAVLFAIYVALGLLVLYLAVRVIRAAWRDGGRKSDGVQEYHDG